MSKNYLFNGYSFLVKYPNGVSLLTKSLEMNVYIYIYTCIIHWGEHARAHTHYRPLNGWISGGRELARAWRPPGPSCIKTDCHISLQPSGAQIRGVSLSLSLSRCKKCEIIELPPPSRIHIYRLWCIHSVYAYNKNTVEDAEKMQIGWLKGEGPETPLYSVLRAHAHTQANRHNIIIYAFYPL
jgi:hypothetical protein